MKTHLPAVHINGEDVETPTLLNNVGDTPLIKLERISSHLPQSVILYAKAEWFNPSGSVKDRPAAAILMAAISEGQLTKDKILLDSTSGNMGISYAMFAASLGYRVHLAIPANASRQRQVILEILGAELTKTDPLEGSDGSRWAAEEIAASSPERYYYADQYRNPNNWKAHYGTTGPEILTQTQRAITHFVAGLGTSGTMMGAGQYLKEENTNIQLIAVQPDGPFHGLEGLKDMDTSPNPEIYEPRLPDQVRRITTEAAYAMVKRLAKEEGLLVGISAGAAAQAALDLAGEIDSGMIVVIFPDSAYKYLDLDFWNVET